MTAVLAAERAGLGIPTTSAALGVPRASAYRWLRPPGERRSVPRAPSPRALAPSEEAHVLTVLHAERFVDKSPAQVHAILLEEGTCVASPRTMYRVLDKHAEVRERRAQRTHPPHAVPVLVARQPNAVWTWDVTALPGPLKGVHYALYVLLDLFSRYVVSWLLAHRESARLAKRLIASAYRQQGIVPGQLTTHSDRGAIQVAKDLHQCFEDLGIVRSLSRPRVSNDNPFSEAQFKTTKYAPGYPGRFSGFAHAERWCLDTFAWYNHDHRHSGIAYLTPAVVHQGRAADVLATRQTALDQAYLAHPERYVNGPPRVPTLPTEVRINRAEDKTAYIMSTR